MMSNVNKCLLKCHEKSKIKLCQKEIVKIRLLNQFKPSLIMQRIGHFSYKG
jgi:hypothetical protein